MNWNVLSSKPSTFLSLGEEDVIDLSNRLRADETLYYPGYPKGYTSKNVWNGTETLGHGIWCVISSMQIVDAFVNLFT